jgi:hypothetical protein
VETVEENTGIKEAVEPKPGLEEAAKLVSILQEIAQVNRERKAVKSDDSAVPEYLWENHLLEGVDNRVW